MTNQKDIIGIVKEHQRKIAENPWPTPPEKMSYVLPMSEMDAIAQALIVCVEALEKYHGWMNGGKKQTAYGRIVDEALSRINSL